MKNDHDRQIERLRAWGTLAFDLLDRLADILVKLLGARPIVTVTILALVVWGAMAEQAGMLVPSLLRLLGR
ncbi:hypothetical protein BH23ACT10_BH23ACT10_39090 [soil metagenome]